ncbi:hypothetical protein ACTFIU_006343 [Dictyostelium citrinum]
MINHNIISFKKFDVIFEQRPEGLEINIPLEIGSNSVDLTSKPFNIKGGSHYKVKISYMASEPITDLICQIHTFRKSTPYGRDTQKVGDIGANSNDLEFDFPKFGWEQASTQSSSMGDYTIKMYFKGNGNQDLATFFYSFNVAPDWENALPIN